MDPSAPRFTPARPRRDMSPPTHVTHSQQVTRRVLGAPAPLIAYPQELTTPSSLHGDAPASIDDAVFRPGGPLSIAWDAARVAPCARDSAERESASSGLSAGWTMK